MHDRNMHVHTKKGAMLRDHTTYTSILHGPTRDANVADKLPEKRKNDKKGEVLISVVSTLCRSWKVLFTNAIRQKASTPKAFQSNRELKEAVDKYSKYNLVDTEEFAQTYGWPIDRWDVANVEDFSQLFSLKLSFNENIASWDVSNATNMAWMFYCAPNFNQDLSSWNVSNVKNMADMFYGASKFNQDLSSWNVSNVTNMQSMFHGASNFNQDLSSWNVPNVTNMQSMFDSASNFNQDLSSWNVSNVTNTVWMFLGASNFNQDVSSWNITTY
eukprot:scaffold115598_cov36-Attheya_sp.AAC.2